MHVAGLGGWIFIGDDGAAPPSFAHCPRLLVNPAPRPALLAATFPAELAAGAMVAALVVAPMTCAIVAAPEC